MKKLTITVTIMLIVYISPALCQNLIVRQNGAIVSFYTQVPAAVSAANSGDTIYIPCGNWNLGSITISKPLHIIGVGHNPAYSQACGVTYLNGNIYLTQGAGNGSISGVFLTGYFGCTSPYHLSDTITNYTATRNRFNGSTPVNLSSGFSYSKFSENVIDGSVTGRGAYNNVFSNNVFMGILVLRFINRPHLSMSLTHDQCRMKNYS